MVEGWGKSLFYLAHIKGELKNLLMATTAAAQKPRDATHKGTGGTKKTLDGDELIPLPTARPEREKPHPNVWVVPEEKEVSRHATRGSRPERRKKNSPHIGGGRAGRNRL